MIRCKQGRPLSVMDICCGLGTISLAGRELTRAVRAKDPQDKRGFMVYTRLPQQLSHATEIIHRDSSKLLPSNTVLRSCLVPSHYAPSLWGSHDVCRIHERLACHQMKTSQMVQTEWAFDKDWDRDHKTGCLTPAKTQFPFDSFMDAYGRTKVKKAVSVEELADGDSISVHIKPCALGRTCMSEDASVTCDRLPLLQALNMKEC